MKTLIHKRVEQARNGLNEKVVCRVNSGWVVIGDVQFLHGYCLLLADPVVESINDLTPERQKEYLYEMAVIGDALIEITGCYRVNYGILGNSEPALHAHIFPRYESEEFNLKKFPAWFYDWKSAPKFNKSEMQPFSDKLLAYLRKRGVVIDDFNK